MDHNRMHRQHHLFIRYQFLRRFNHISIITLHRNHQRFQAHSIKHQIHTPNRSFLLLSSHMPVVSTGVHQHQLNNNTNKWAFYKRNILLKLLLIASFLFSSHSIVRIKHRIQLDIRRRLGIHRVCFTLTFNGCTQTNDDFKHETGSIEIYFDMNKLQLQLDQH